MAKNVRNFIAGRMNKTIDARMVPNGEYIDALNIRIGSAENDSEAYVLENAKGNYGLTDIKYIDGTPISDEAKCIGKFADSANETIYWFIHDPAFTVGATGKLDLIVSYNTITSTLSYHIISIDDSEGVDTTLNFNPSYLITGINKIDDLIFFTDYYNEPRFFNVKRNYAIPVGNQDQFSAESILVIKKPPIESPSITTFLANGQENYIDTRFICFAYRYKYADNEYSAISQFSAPAFTPNPFNFSIDSYLNEGMVNIHNTVEISFNTGGPLVVGIDLIFIEAQSTGIPKVIEKLIKKDLGYPDDTVIKYTFNNSKIFTILPSYEMLRLFDNVPRYAKSQTLMGNRIMYGNYIEGYNMFDVNAQPVQLSYVANLVSEDIGSQVIPDTTDVGDYNIDGNQTIADSILKIDLSGLTFPLVPGGSLSIEIILDHQEFSGGTISETSTNIQLFFTFNISQAYTSAYQLASSTEFQEAVGVVGGANGIQVTPATWCDGNKLTDNFNCNIPTNLSTYTKTESGVDIAPQPILVVRGDPTTASPIIGLQFPAMKFVDGTNVVYEYYKVTYAQAIYQEVANPKSLHSNRGYEVGIVYQDDFLRSTTTLVSANNTVFVPCGNSEKQNSIQITIPTIQRPPEWATRYKFVIKADVENYDTIYSSIFFNDPLTNATYILLEGENAQKVETGDRLIVKRDSDGALQSCAYATILEKEVKAEGFISIPSVLNPAEDVAVPAGVYAKINSNSFSTVTDDSLVVAPGRLSVVEKDANECPELAYYVNTLDTTTNLYVDYTIPAGSQIKLFFKFERLGLDGTNCDVRKYTIDKTLVSSANYANFKEWWDGDNVEVVLNQGTYEIRDGACIPDNQYNNILMTTYAPLDCDDCINHFQFYRSGVDNSLQLLMNGPPTCSGLYKQDKRWSKIWAEITVFRAGALLVFETEPSETLPDVFYENELSYPIINGNHQGIAANGDTNQDITGGIAGVINTGFFNCYTFGNGVESYKIRDSITGKTFNFGNRVTSVSAQDYKQANRYADITYSGIYNNESNVNKLNEFNIGLANFKQLENSFGTIQILDARETDVLVLQEDKISYVLAGKNLLTDASAAGQITSVPEVLGTQIARTEKFGISANPESYVHWGENRFFTDTKRGAVIQLKGSNYSQDSLLVISEMGMRSYFRDLFIETFNKQKLGAYDPFTNEYVLAANDIDIPGDVSCVGCGMRQIFTVEPYEDLEYCINAGRGIGEAVITWTVLPTGCPFEIIATYNGTTVSSGTVTGSGSLVVNKNSQNIETIDILIQSTCSITLTMTVACPLSELMTVVQICVTNDDDAGGYIHNEYGYVNGTYVSPISSQLITFQAGSNNPLVSNYSTFTDYAGTGAVPNSGTDVRIICAKNGFDTFDFDSTNNKFLYLVSSTLYSNTPTDIAALLAAATIVTPNQSSGLDWYAEFTMPGTNDYLYLIWDYRTAHAVELCYGETSTDSCCDCEECDSECAEYFISNSSSGTIVSFTDCYTGLPDTVEIVPYTGEFVCSRTVPVVDSGSAQIVTVSACGCDTCENTYGGGATFEVEVFDLAEISYIPYGSVTPITAAFDEGTYQFCTSGLAPEGVYGVISISFIQCGCA